MATKIKILYKNYWSGGTIYNYSNQHPQYPVEDTQADTKLLFWRTQSGEDDDEYMDIDLTFAYASNFIALLNHNLSTGATIKLWASNSSTFASYDEIVIPQSGNNIFKSFTSPGPRQYWRLKIQDASNPNNYIKVATILLGLTFEPNNSFGKGYSLGRDDLTEPEFSDSLVLYSREKPPLKAWNLPFKSLDEISKNRILDLLENFGIHKAFIVIFDSDNPVSDSHLVRLEEITYPEYMHVDNWNWEMIIKEVL